MVPGSQAINRFAARLGVVERLTGQELAFQQAPVPFEVGLGELEVGLALTDGGLRDLV